MYCPKCGKKYKNERICPTCHRVLVDERPDPSDVAAPGLPPPIVPDAGPDHDGLEGNESQSGAETVFQTKDTGLLPLATMALDSAGIHYVVHGGGSDMFGIASGIELRVRPADATEARRLLADLEQAGEQESDGAQGAPSISEDASEPSEVQEAPPIEEAATVDLIDVETGRPVTSVTPDHLEWLARKLQRDSLGSYYLDSMTIEMLEGDGADPGLVEALRRATAGRDGVDLRPSLEPQFDQRTARPAQQRAEATIAVVDTQHDRNLGAITEGQALWLADRVHQEPAVFGKPDYCIDGDVIDYLEEEGAEPDLLDMLRKALGDRDEMFVRW